jgi:putative nucleotidyltransferase with HDIG domain
MGWMRRTGVRGGRVLLASADSATQATLRAMLATSDCVTGVDEAWTVEEAYVSSAAVQIVLLDARCVTDGTLREAIEELRNSPGEPAVVVVADESEPRVVREALDAGAVSFLLTWADVRQLHATLDAAFDRRGMIDAAVVRPVIDVYASLFDDAKRRNRAVIESLAQAVEAKDAVTSLHLRAVSRLAQQLARQVDSDIADADDFLFGCLLHDVGKIGVPERILMKPGPLTEDEWVVMRLHPDTGARVVRPLGLSDTVLDVVLHHHERWDGSGYPCGLSGKDIPLSARIFSVCDALEAMTAARPYREALPAGVALERVRIEAGGQFDPDIVHALDRGVAAGNISIEDPLAGTVPRRRFARSRRRDANHL